MPRLDRLVSLEVPAAPGVNGGLTGGVTGFRMFNERFATLVIGDTALVAIGAGGSPVAAAGTWLTGSVITYVRGGYTIGITFLRAVTWASSTLSLATGLPWVSTGNKYGTAAEVTAPYITSPAWFRIPVPFGTPATAVTAVNVSAVLPLAAGGRRSAWAGLVDESYDETVESQAGRDVPRVVGTSTWVLRRRHNVRPFTVLYDGDVSWTVIAVREQGGKRRAPFVEVDATREYVGAG